MKNKVETQQGITLVMLVVTIVVILILAGVSYHLVIGNNGIISKAEEATVITRAGQVEEEVALWKSDTYIADHTNATSETETEMIERLRFHKFITEDDEVDTIGKVIKIKKKDGTVVKEISYSNVVINIRKTPETGNTGFALLEVTSVEGLEPIGINMKIETQEDEDKLLAMIEQMNINRKIELYKELIVTGVNKQEGTEFRNFTEYFNYLKETDPDFPYETEADLEKVLKEDPEGMKYIIEDSLSFLYYNKETHELKTYEIINPEGEVSDHYIAIENGTYTFTVKNFITNETYSKTIEITNIDIEINISKTPETEKATSVLLNVDSIEGGILPYPQTEEEIVSNLRSMNYDLKIYLCQKLEIQWFNKNTGNTFTTFKQVVQYAFEHEYISENSEEAYFTEFCCIETEEDLNNWIFDAMSNFSITDTYIIINPDGKLSNYYTVSENGTYTFTIKDVFTNTTYNKTIEVKNIDESTRYYVANVMSDELYEEKKNTREADWSSSYIVLRDRNDNSFTTFEQAYIISDNNDKYDISGRIYSGNIFSKIKAYTNPKYAEKCLISLVKDGIEYRGYVLMDNRPS